MQNHELVSETVLGLEAVYSVKLRNGVTLESRQALTTNDENHRAVAKKFGVRSISEQLRAKGIAWTEVVAPAPPPVIEPKKADPEPQKQNQAEAEPEPPKRGIFGGSKGHSKGVI